MKQDKTLQIQETQWTPNRIIPKKSMPRQIIIRLLKSKEKEEILKAVREKWGITYGRTPIWMIAHFLSETMEVIKKWHNIFWVLKQKLSQPQILCLVKSSFRNEKEIKTFSNESKLKEFTTSRLTFEEWWKLSLQTDR